MAQICSSKDCHEVAVSSNGPSKPLCSLHSDQAEMTSPSAQPRSGNTCARTGCTTVVNMYKMSQSDSYCPKHAMEEKFRRAKEQKNAPPPAQSTRAFRKEKLYHLNQEGKQILREQKTWPVARKSAPYSPAATKPTPISSRSESRLSTRSSAGQTEKNQDQASGKPGSRVASTRSMQQYLRKTSSDQNFRSAKLHHGEHKLSTFSRTEGGKESSELILAVTKPEVRIAVAPMRESQSLPDSSPRTRRMTRQQNTGSESMSRASTTRINRSPRSITKQEIPLKSAQLSFTGDGGDNDILVKARDSRYVFSYTTDLCAQFMCFENVSKTWEVLAWRPLQLSVSSANVSLVVTSIRNQITQIVRWKTCRPIIQIS